MKKILYVLRFVCVSLFIFSSFYAGAQTNDDIGQKKSIRLFLNTGEILNYDATEVDSITVSPEMQTIWMTDTCRTIALESIDSIWYMSPTLKLATSSLNFGKVALGNRKTCYVTITNTGQYPESYCLFADGVFKASYSGKNIEISTCESHDVELVFEPSDSIVYKSNLMMLSSAFGEGLSQLPLVGEGVAVDSLEEDIILPPSEEGFLMMLPDDVAPESLADFKIVNSYGEFPVSVSAASRAHRIARKNGKQEYFWEVPTLVSPNGPQFHFFVDGLKIPYLFSITLPGEKPKMSVEETAISLLMTEPMLMTSNEAEYRNTVQCIKQLDSYQSYLSQVRKLYIKGVEDSMCPDYSEIDTKPLLRELAKNVFDNRDMVLSGVSLVEKDITPESAKYRVHNDLRRTLHIYPSRIKNDNSGRILDRQDASPTLTDKIDDWLKEYLEEKISSDILDDDDIANLKELKEMVSELEEQFASVVLGPDNARIHLPITLDSQHSNYWKIVKGSLLGDKSSPFSITSDPIVTSYEGYDRAYIDVYGLGKFNKPWENYTNEEQIRIIFALIHGGYKDFIKPAMDFAAGIKAAAKATGSDDYKYDLRYGSRKYPFLMLFTRLALDLVIEERDTFKKIKEELKNGDNLEAAKDVLAFMYDRICTKPKDESTQSKRSYFNLIYNCYKKITNDPKKSEEFRKNFKDVANNLTYLKEASFISKVISLSELGLDLIGTIDAVRLSNVQETFIVNKSIYPYISVIAPQNLYFGTNNKVYFEWSTYKAQYTTPFLYDLELIVETPDKCERTIVSSKMEDNCCEYDLSQLPGSANARRILFRIIARLPENLSSSVAMTDEVLLVNMIKEVRPKFVDLGLPSGTLWAVSNLGTTQATESGNYYAWGELKDKNTFSWSNYSYSNKSHNKLTKYCTKSSYGNNGFTDNITDLQGKDDPASYRWGYWYSIPTKEDWEELITYCDWIPNSYFGYSVKSKKNDEQIYLPFAGYRSGYDHHTDLVGNYWTSELDSMSPDDAWFLNIEYNKKPVFSSYYRCYGRSVRPVLHKKPIVPPTPLE